MLLQSLPSKRRVQVSFSETLQSCVGLMVGSLEGDVVGFVDGSEDGIKLFEGAPEGIQLGVTLTTIVG